MESLRIIELIRRAPWREAVTYLFLGGCKYWLMEHWDSIRLDGREEDGGYFTGEQLDERLNQIQHFLITHFPKADEDDD